jgi:hypothetical protein
MQMQSTEISSLAESASGCSMGTNGNHLISRCVSRRTFLQRGQIEASSDWNISAKKQHVVNVG